MRYWMDTEFIDDGKTIDLISIGIVCEDGRELYIQSGEFNIYNANDWVKENVFPYLKQCPHTLKNGMQSVHSHGNNAAIDLLWQLGDHQVIDGQCTFKDPEKGIIGAHADCYWRTRAQICDEMKTFFNPSDGIELWGWCAGYDFVAFCQLFGTMMDLPQGYPHYINDLQQELDRIGLEDSDLPPQKGTAHNALEDARYIKKLLKWLEPEPLPELSDSEREQWGISSPEEM